MEKDVQICPWCQSEIVWDEEIGPEEECPHCLNPLSEYNSVTLRSSDAEESEADEDPEDVEDEWDEEAITSESGPGVPEVEDDIWLNYESGVERILDNQEETVECDHCREFMVYAGEQLVTEPDFRVPADAASVFLTPPFRLRVHVCPSCFRVTTSLSEEDRMRIVMRFGGSK